MDQGAENRLKNDARRIFSAALRAVDPTEAIDSVVKVQNNTIEIKGQRFDLPKNGRIWVVGAGKAAALMADALEALLGDRITGGQVTVKDKHSVPLNKILVGEASHPVPEKRGQVQAEQVLRLLKQTAEADLVLCLISGGGSALWPVPAEGITLADKIQTTEIFLACGATINEINCVRKHISQIKGGQLARAAAPSAVLTLILSDVIGDPLDVISSGPTAPDQSTYEQALDVIRKYDVMRQLPGSVLEHLQRGMDGHCTETPKQDDPCFARVQNFIISNNQAALVAAVREAATIGYHPWTLPDPMQGEAREAIDSILIKAETAKTSGDPVAPPSCILAGGETTVTLGVATGKGGRNQEMALVAAVKLAGKAGIVFLAAGTDGTDGPTDAAGAVVDGLTISRGQKLGRDARQYLVNHDSYSYFAGMEEHIITGPTLTNVMDIYMVLVDRPVTESGE